MSNISIVLLSFSHIRGILCVVAAMAIFLTQDMAIKWLSGDYPLHEVVLIRSIVAIIIIVTVFLPSICLVSAMSKGTQWNHFCRLTSVVLLSCCCRCMANLSDVDLFSPGVKSVKLDGVYQKV